MPTVNTAKTFDDTKSALQQAEKNIVNQWVASIEGGKNAFDAGKDVTKQIKKLKGTPAVAKTGTHELCVGQVNRVFFKYTSAVVTLTAVGHT